MIILFDVDGVLVKNRAYRAALRQTVAFFAQRLGYGELTLTEAHIDRYEAESITVEWDSGAISVAGLVSERLLAAADAGGGETGDWEAVPDDFWAALSRLPAPRRAPHPPDFARLAQLGSASEMSGVLPSHRALAHLMAELNGRLPPAALAVAARLISQLLGDCYDLQVAPVTQVFQNYALGHRLYEDYYGLTPHVESEPLLEALDRPNLAPQMSERLLSGRAAGRVYPVLYTARPSLAPAEVVPAPLGYTPEAEIARRMVGLDSVPVMGYGKVDWLARRVGRRGLDFVKPSPVQAMAAIALARSGLETESLKAAFAVERGDHLRFPLTACAGEKVHVFEDSASSLRGVKRAVEAVNRQGLGLRLIRHGIAPADSAKRAALAPAADHLHADVNDGLAQILP